MSQIFCSVIHVIGILNDSFKMTEKKLKNGSSLVTFCIQIYFNLRVMYFSEMLIIEHTESKKMIPEVHLGNIKVSIISFNITQLSSTVLLNVCSLQLFIFSDRQ